MNYRSGVSSAAFYGLESGSLSQEATAGSDGGFGSSAAPIATIGGASGQGSQPFKPYCVCVFNRLLTEAEMQSLHNDWFGTLFDSGGGSQALAATAVARASASGSLSNTGAGTRTVSAELVDEDGSTPMANLSGLRVVLWQDFAAFAAGAAPLQVLTGQTTNAAGLIQFSGPGSLVVGTDSAWAVITNQDASPDAIERASVGAMDVT
jgi:hypothetical protein